MLKVKRANIYIKWILKINNDTVQPNIYVILFCQIYLKNTIKKFFFHMVYRESLAKLNKYY